MFVFSIKHYVIYCQGRAPNSHNTIVCMSSRYIENKERRFPGTYNWNVRNPTLDMFHVCNGIHEQFHKRSAIIKRGETDAFFPDWQHMQFKYYAILYYGLWLGVDVRGHITNSVA